MADDDAEAEAVLAPAQENFAEPEFQSGSRLGKTTLALR
jgi:hypothetical protein